MRACRLQQRGQCGSFRPALRGVIAGLRGAVRIGAVMPIRRCLKVAGIQDAARVKPGNGGNLEGVHHASPSKTAQTVTTQAAP